MSEVTSPILLDSTGQTTNTKLDNINTALGNINTILGQIKNVLTTPSDADDINYDNTQSGLTATNAQDAIDEINSSLIELTPKTKPFDDTTNAQGNIVISSIDTSTTLVLGLITDNGSVEWRFGATSSKQLVINFYTTNNTVLTNTRVTGTVYYM